MRDAHLLIVGHVVNYFSHGLLSLLNFFSSFLSTESAVRAYSKLSVDGVVLSPSLLSRFLELCREQIQHVPLPNPFVQLHKLAHEVLQRIRNTQGSCTIENYHATLRILDASKQPSE